MMARVASGSGPRRRPLRPAQGKTSKMLLREKEFFRRNREQLLESYEGHYLAIVGESVVDHDEDFSSLAERSFARYGVRPIYMPRATRQEERFDLTSPRRTA